MTKLFSFELTSELLNDAARGFDMDDSINIELSEEAAVQLNERLTQAVWNEIAEFLEELLD
jgi:hypothetical protein